MTQEVDRIVRVGGSGPGRGWGALLLAILAAGILAAGCHRCDDCDDGDDCDWCWDHTPPAVPSGLWSVTGDEEVLLLWCPNTERDLDGYRIYRNTEPRGYFPRIATVRSSATSYLDRGLRNGVTYYYVIAAFDDSGNESDLTPDPLWDTPRPEGGGLRLYNSRTDPERSGYDFSRYRVVDFRELEADLYYWHGDEDGPWMIATERTAEVYTDIQDAGYLPLDDVDWAPEEGWSPTGEVPLIEGHSYVVWTWDNHFAKFRVASISEDRVILDWAYQTDEGNPQFLGPGAARPARPATGGLRVHEHGLKRGIVS